MEGRSLKDLRSRNIVVWDAEIKNTIDGRNITWNDHDKMEVSVACLFDYRDGDSKVYMDDNLHELADRLNDADIIVGFNIRKFDIPLLQASLQNRLVQSPIMEAKIYDLLEEVRRSTGQRYPKSCSLNHVLEATFGIKKTEDGALAPIMFRQGNIGRLITYCLADVRRERMAFEYAYLHGHLKTAAHGIHTMRNPLA